MSAGTINRGESYWVDILPAHTVGVEQQKRQPFIVMSKDSVHNGLPVIGDPLTTKVAQARSHPILIPAVEVIKPPFYAGTCRNSVALTDQIRALSMSR